MAQEQKSFFASFCSQKEAFLFAQSESGVRMTRLTADYIGRRIEHAGAVMRCLCVKHPSTLLAQGREVFEGYMPGSGGAYGNTPTVVAVL
jgi:hypothetical protein